ncbi:MAG: glycoside hydrolase family 43 protein [Aristaeellaceae bacterium]
MKLSDINIRDPFVLLHEDKYYLYGTRGATCWGEADGFDVYVSDDLENWSEPHEIFHNDGSFWADRNYWAPEVYLWQGAFYMFASFKAEGVCRGTCILKADSPMGPFVPHSDGPVTPHDWECLDGTFYVNKEGKPFMVFCHEWKQVIDGEICAMELTDDLSAPAGSPRLLFTASQAEWVLPHLPKQGQPAYVTDGPFMWRNSDGTLLMLWASFSRDGYTQGLARSSNGEITGEFKQVKPLFMKDGGHGMIFRTREGKLLMTLHSPNTHLEERPYFFEVVEEDGLLHRK